MSEKKLKFDKIKFETLKIEEKKLLLSALDINIDSLKCEYCDEKVRVSKVSILPRYDSNSPVIVCDSLMCISEWLEDNTI